MQSRASAAKVKAKLIALPALRWIKSEIPTLASFALQGSSLRIFLFLGHFPFVVFFFSFILYFSFLLFPLSSGVYAVYGIIGP